MVCWGQFHPSKVIGRGGGTRTTSISYSAKVCDYFHDKFKFHNFINAFMIFGKCIIVHKIVKFKYFVNEIIYLKSPGHLLYNVI